MQVSIFTPTHDPRWIRDAYESIRDQRFDEWTILYNQGAQPVGFDDPRVKEHVAADLPPYVGALKRRAVELCSGDVLIELDHDDLLMPEAVAKVREAFEDEAVGFAYSNTIRVQMDGGKTERWSAAFGWQYRPAEYAGHQVDEVVGFDPTPASVSRIWFAPDHLRAFRRSSYDAAGGYNAEMRVLDDEDLMCRMYQLCEFKHIDEPLYVFRIHGGNTWLTHNGEIQENVWRLYDQYIEPMALSWAKRADLATLDLGGGIARAQGYTSVDLLDADVCCDLNERWPFEDGSVGVVRAFDVFEHLADPLHTMTELYRVLAPGGYAFIQVPSTDGRGAYQDPTHTSWWNQNSWLYYTDIRWAHYIGAPVRFQAMRSYTTELDDMQVCWTRAHLLKLADGMRVPGGVTI